MIHTVVPVAQWIEQWPPKPCAQVRFLSGTFCMKERSIQPKAVIADTIRAAFQESGQRNTRPRRFIAERLIQLAESGTDFTIDDLWHDLRRDEPRMGRATVYRAVEKLVGQGLLNRVEFADGSHHFRVCGGAHHHHLTCTQCHRVVEVQMCLPAEQMASISRQTDFAIEGHSLTLFGRCADCRMPEHRHS